MSVVLAVVRHLRSLGTIALSTALLAMPAVSMAGGADHDANLDVRDFGAVCDGVTDDTAALRRAFDYRNYHVELPAATCAFKTAPLVLDRPFGSVTGAGMWGTSRLLYIGSKTDTDLLQIGSGSTKPSGLTSTGYTQFRDFAVESAVKMTGGFAIHEMGTQFVLIQNIALGRQHNAVTFGAASTSPRPTIPMSTRSSSPRRPIAWPC